MNSQNLELVKKLINQIADSYQLPSEEQVKKMHTLTGITWTAEALQNTCCEYWSHHSLDEIAYLMLNGNYPPIIEKEISFWKLKKGAVIDPQKIYETCQSGKNLKALEELPADQIMTEITAKFPGWEEERYQEEGQAYRFVCKEPAEYWKEISFWVFLYGHQMISFSCKNLSENHQAVILECLKNYGCCAEWITDN